MNIEHLHHERVPRLRRSLLLRAASAVVPLAHGAGSECEAISRRHSANGLQRLGLVDQKRMSAADRRGRWFERTVGYMGPRGGLVHLELTDLGRAVVACYATELENNKPIRWRKLSRYLARQAAGQAA